MLPQGQKALLTICLEELVSASFVNCAKHVNKKVHFIQVLKYLVFMHPRDKFNAETGRWRDAEIIEKQKLYEQFIYSHINKSPKT
jgi:hypothetical protein